MESNLNLYNKFAPVPEKAKKKITGGKLSGKTDINPMWRIKMLTEEFGPVGFGWFTEIKEHWTDAAGSEQTAWVRINLFVKDTATGEWSRPIEGVGGSKIFGKGMGDGINDEAFKMAETDAISVACKKLGMGANVYWDADKTKYTMNEGKVSAPASAPAQASPAPAQAQTQTQAQAAPAQASPAPAQAQTQTQAQAAPAPKKVIAEGNENWQKALDFCTGKGVRAEALRKWYELDQETIDKINAILDFKRE